MISTYLYAQRVFHFLENSSGSPSCTLLPFRTNALGSKGQIATEYGSLVQELWSGNKRVVAPLRLRESVNRHVQTFKERAQHDCQEFLAFLLDGLHEDLNRVHSKPYATLKDSDGRPDDEVAKEAWDLHVARDQSIVMDLFSGMLKSCVTCKQCNNSSVRFDPFTFLQLPIPLEDSLLLQVVVVKRSGDVPFRYGFRLSGKTPIKTLEEQVGEKCGLSREQFVVICLKKNGQLWNMANPGIGDEDSPIKTLTFDALLYAFERPSSVTTAKPKVSPTPNGVGTHGSLVHRAVEQHHFNPGPNAVLAVHRKMEHKDVYFLSHKRSHPVVFGVPLVVELAPNATTCRDLYEDVWRQVKRLVNAPAAQNSGALGNHTNRALDADEGRHDDYPFTLKLVDENFEHCSKCEWFQFCYGCSIVVSDQVIADIGVCNIAVDWEPTALYLRYQHSAELLCVDDASVTATWDAHYKPVSLMSCLQDFTTPEQLEDGEMVHCKHCKANTPATLCGLRQECEQPQMVPLQR
uniref:ubiquitinyl hydrolase 1 n=1 Tax=Plectus sambesii TaxID=2011161 RepID=A0A914XR81_9BILA